MNRPLFQIGVVFAVLFLPFSALADGEQDNHPENVRRVPALGIEVPEADRQELEAGLTVLAENLAGLRRTQDVHLLELLPDVSIYHRAVREALDYQEFFSPAEIKQAKTHLQTGLQRAEQLASGKAPWTTQTGLVVRGFVSRLDGSVQPYGLVIPANYRGDGERDFRLDIWFHGRGETLSENNFLSQRSSAVGTYAPANTIVLHPYGRYSNAFKFAGEVDVLEALEDVKRRYRIDGGRVSVRGFSMGGAGCWQFAVHYADQWFAANPGAGFSETPEFLKFFQKQQLQPTWWEKKLWRLYDCTDWAGNLYHCPTVAYSGELDIQKQAADIMAESLRREGIDLVHVIGPQMGHKIDPDSAALIDAKMASLSARAPGELPDQVRLVTYTLKYPKMHWVTVTGLKEHWERSTVVATMKKNAGFISVQTENVTSLALEFDAGETPFDVRTPVKIEIDGQSLTGPRPRSDRSWRLSLRQAEGRWSAGEPAGMRKQHNLQGPIDDALMDSFLFVTPTGTSSNALVEKWTRSERERAVEHWRRHFRGHVRIRKDSELTPEDIQNHHLILWGDPQANSVIKQVAPQLPIQWQPEQIAVGNRQFPAANHALILVHPNPLNPRKYVVLNSSFTFREFAYLNNARQVPMLPDWAVVHLDQPADAVWPGKIVAAAFFDERWQLKPPAEDQP